MKLRPELCAPMVAPERIWKLCAAIESIAAQLERGEPADDAIDAFNAGTNHQYSAEHFLTYWESRSVEDFALEAARPARPRISDITRDEMIEVVRRIQAADNESAYYCLLLDTNTVHPSASDLIFHPPAELGTASAEVIVDAILSYRPIPG